MEDFIEKLFGVSPDGGDGSFEFLLFAVPLAGIALIAAFRARRRKQRTGDLPK